MKNKIKYCTSSPLWIYVALSFGALIFVVSSYLIKPEYFWQDFLFNIGCGLIASVIVAILTDIGATKRQRDTDKEVFIRMNIALKEKCRDLPVDLNTSVYECCGYDIEGKYTFSEWICRLFDISSLSESEKKKHFDEIGYFLQTVSEIEDMASQQEKHTRLQYRNEYFNVTYENRLERLRANCKVARAQFKQEKLEACKDTIVDRMVPIISELFEDISDDFCRKYNAEDYME